MPISFSDFLTQQKSGTLPVPQSDLPSTKPMPSFSTFLARTQTLPPPEKLPLLDRIKNGIANITKGIEVNANPPVTPTPAPDFSKLTDSSIGKLNPNAKTTPDLSTLSKRLAAPTDMLPWWAQAGQVATNVIVNQVKDQTQKFQDLSNSIAGLNPDGTKSTLTGNQQKLDIASKSGSVLMSMANSAFLPLTSIMSGAGQLPVIKNVAQPVNNLFAKAGQGGTAVFDSTLQGAVDNNYISPTTANIVKPLGDQIASLLSQVALGKVSLDIVRPELEAKTTEIQKVITNDNILRNRYVDANTNPVLKTSTIPSFADWKAQGEPKAPATTPTPVIEASKPVNAGISNELKPLAQETTIPTTSKTFTPEQGTIPETVGTGEIKTSKLASDIAQTLQTETSGLAEYKTMNMADQASKALDLITKDPGQAKAIAMGEEPAPTGLLKESIYTALREIAKTKEDVQTLLDLAKSDVASMASIYGQHIKALDVGDTSNDPVKIIQDVQKFREASASKKGLTPEKITKVESVNMENALKSTRSTRESWESFIKKIQCNY